MSAEGFIFDKRGAERVVAAVRWAEKKLTDLRQPRRRGGRSQSGVLAWGKPTAAFSSGVTITLDPCDVGGVDNGQPNETVYLRANKALYSMHNSTTIPTSEIVTFARAADGGLYVVGRPKVFLTDYRDSGNNADGFQVKTVDDFGSFCGTESGWVSKADTEAFACPS